MLWKSVMISYMSHWFEILDCWTQIYTRNLLSIQLQITKSKYSKKRNHFTPCILHSVPKCSLYCRWVKKREREASVIFALALLRIQNAFVCINSMIHWSGNISRMMQYCKQRAGEISCPWERKKICSLLLSLLLLLLYFTFHQ